MPPRYERNSTVINSDTKRFIQYFLPKGFTMNRMIILNTCRTFHLAFKGMEASEIYDIMMEQLLKAAQKYDARYTEKICRVVDVLKAKANRWRAGRKHLLLGGPFFNR